MSNEVINKLIFRNGLCIYAQNDTSCQRQENLKCDHIAITHDLTLNPDIMKESRINL